MATQTLTADAGEIERFSRIAEEWWDEKGKFAPLHRMNPLRLAYIRDQVCAHFGRDASQLKSLSSLSLLDIGCGGGLLCEPTTRLGVKVTGIDASEKNIAVASLHAQKMGLVIEYRCATPEALVGSQQSAVSSETNTANCQLITANSYDIVLALEIVEHVSDIPAFLAACAALVKPGGLLFMSTLNRTAKSYALAIVGAEYILRWLPRGTHTWKKFVKPSELCAGLRQQGIDITHMTGMVFHPLKNSWRMDEKDMAVNYILTAVKPSP